LVVPLPRRDALLGGFPSKACTVPCCFIYHAKIRITKIPRTVSPRSSGSSSYSSFRWQRTGVSTTRSLPGTIRAGLPWPRSSS